MPVTKVKVNGEWIPAMPVGGGGEGDMTKAVYDTNDDGVVNAADQATKDGSGNVITSTYAAKATTLSGYGITDAKIENGSIILGSNSITPLTSFTETDPVFSASAAYGISSTDITNWDKIYGLFTVTSGNSDGDYWWVLKIPQSGLYRYTNAPGSSGGLKEIYLPHNGSSRNTVIINDAYTEASNTLTLPNKTGTFALTSDIPTVPTNISAFTNDSGYITSYTETDPIFTASAAYNISSSDITNWNNKSGYIIGYCDTPAADAVKEIQIFDPQFEGQSTSGETLLIRFKYGNNNTSSSLAFKIGDTTRLASVCYFYDYSTGSSTTSKTFTKGIHALELDNDGWNFYKGCDVHTAFQSARATKAIQDNSGNTITSTYATKAEIPTVPTNVSAFTNDAGYITSYIETDPVFSASAAAGITSTDITNWNNKVSDDHNWGGVSLGSGRKDSTSDQWIPCKDDTNNTSGTAYWIKTTQELPTSSSVEFIQIPRYKKIDNQWYLQSTTPTSTDNSIKVATTAFVQTVLGGYIASDTTANFTISDTAPSNPQTGDLWLDTNSQSASGIAYLPLSAGENHPLTGNLDLEIGNSANRNIYFLNNGEPSGCIRDTGTYIYIGRNNSSWGIPAGMVASDSNVWVYGNSGSVILSPAGEGSNVGRWAFGNNAITTIRSNAGTIIGKYEAYPDNLYFGSVSSDSNTRYAGLCSGVTTQHAILYAGGATIYLRPNGVTNSTGQFTIDSTGNWNSPRCYARTLSGSTLVVDSSGNIGRTSSLRKYKKDIEDVTKEQANKGYELHPITYVSAIENDTQERQFGLIAEEVEEIIPELCTHDLEGNADGVAYERVCSLLLKQNQMLKVQVDALEKRVEELERR